MFIPPQHVPSLVLRAHAALSPWQGQNALDAAVAAYTNVSLLRQQVKPSHRIHGVFEGKDWAANGECLSM
jgi:metal-dependent amidase/aminoacylase/carboxypeptidase family protein